MPARANQTWVGTLDNQWTNTGNWSGSAVPAASDVVIYTNSIGANLSNWLEMPFTVAGLFYSNRAQSPFITLAGSPLTIGTSGINISNTSDLGFTNNEPVALNGSQNWNSGGSMIVMNNAVTGTGNIVFSGHGTILAASNAFDGTLSFGPLAVTPHRLYCKHPAALGTNALRVGFGSTLCFAAGSDAAPIRTPFTIESANNSGSFRVTDGIRVRINSNIVCTNNANFYAESNASYTIDGNILGTNGFITFTLYGAATSVISACLNLGAAALQKEADPFAGTNSTLTLLNSSNLWSGGTTVNGGTLQIGDGATSGYLPGNVQVHYPAQLAFATPANTSQIFSGSIDGNGSLIKDGAGGLYIVGSNTFTGNITNNAGAMWFTSSNNFGTGSKSICLTNNLLHGGIHLNGTNGNILVPPGISWYLGQDEGSIVNEAGDNVINGPVNVSASGGDAYLKVNSGSLTLNGQLRSTATKILRFGGAGSGTNNGNLVSGYFLKLDSGSWTFNGVASSSGSNAVTGGTLVMNGQLSSLSTMWVFTNGTLSGYGIINGATAIVGGGTLALGADIGTLSVSNVLTLNGTNVMKISKINGSTSNDLVRGMSTLNLGGTLRLVATGSNWSVGDSFKLYDSKKYVGGFVNFNLPSLPSGMAWDISGVMPGGDGKLRIVGQPPAVLKSASLLQDGSLRVTFVYTGVQSVPYTIWASTDLWQSANTWVPLSTGSISSSPASYDDLASTNFSRRFYRISIP